MKIPHISQYRLLALEPRALQMLTQSVQDPVALQAHIAQASIMEAFNPPDPTIWQAGGGVVVMDVCGALSKYSSSLSEAPAMIDLRFALRRLASDPNVAGIILRFDTPGGSVSGTGDFADEIMRTAMRMPCWAFCEDLCASAGYWLASQTKRISCTLTSDVGCIGTYFVIHDLSAVARAEGIKVNVVKAGKFKGAGVPGTEITDEQLAMFQETIDSTNYQFIMAVARGRGLSPAAVLELADGRVHIGEAAMRLGLVDAVESLEQTVERMQKQVQVKTGGILRSGRPLPPTIEGEAYWMSYPVEQYSRRKLTGGMEMDDYESRKLQPARRAAVSVSAVPALPAAPAAEKLPAKSAEREKPTEADFRKAFALRNRDLQPLAASTADIARYMELGLSPAEAVGLKNREPATAEEIRTAFRERNQAQYIPDPSEEEIAQYTGEKLSAAQAISRKHSAHVDQQFRRRR